MNCRYAVSGMAAVFFKELWPWQSLVSGLLCYDGRNGLIGARSIVCLAYLGGKEEVVFEPHLFSGGKYEGACYR